jgi:hypothetical protein
VYIDSNEIVPLIVNNATRNKMFEKRASSHRDQGVDDVQLSRLEQKTEELVELTIDIIKELTAKELSCVKLCSIHANVRNFAVKCLFSDNKRIQPATENRDRPHEIENEKQTKPPLVALCQE